MTVTNKKNYFTQDTEDAIVAYNLSVDYGERSKIYDERINYAFFKLTQNIIHTFKFYHTEVENIEDLQHEIIIFLLSKIHLFDPSKGAKAYSYFGTIVKRWLILYNDKNYKKKVASIPVSVLEEDNSFSYTIEENNSPSDKLSHGDKMSLFMDLYVEYCTENLEALFPKDQDAKIADAILELFRKREHLDIFNKKALYIYIREMIDAKTPKITKIADRLHKIFKTNYIFYLENGHIKFH
jgi:DNA-directed RNA polymerase specialized sigma subunit